jgi:hypothetical protein
MKALIFLVTGLITVGVGFIVFFATHNASTTSATSAAASVGIDLGMTMILPSIICWGVGGLLTLFGIFGLLGGMARNTELKEIAAGGVQANAQITFLDRNYTLLLNNRPVYSIVEYVFRDNMGREIVRRADNIKTDQVIRAGWQVGSMIQVRYLPQNPYKSGIMFAEI